MATSDKGGAGRTVTSCNLAYQSALMGKNVCYLDFDFGSPTAGTVFSVESVSRGTTQGGLHGYLRGTVDQAERVYVWQMSERQAIRSRPERAGDLVLMPGDIDGGEFESAPDIVLRCVDLFLTLESEYDVIFVDLSAGRSHATQIVLEALTMSAFEAVDSRWLVYHRWTKQHIIAAEGLVYGGYGLIKTGATLGHDEQRLLSSIRFVRTAVVDPDSDSLAGFTAPQVAWLRVCNDQLHELAGALRVGRTQTVGEIPLDPVLQWREQILTSTDTRKRHIANQDTVRAFIALSDQLVNMDAWAETL